ncbi:MAG: hypothetical protein AB1585_16050 [Thermodesulfobacteriota bacterium]
MPEPDARTTVENFFKAFNNHDNEAYLKTLHFPHFRINGQGQIRITEKEADFPPLDKTLSFLTEKEGWHHSTLDVAEVIHASEAKVHFDIQFSRYRAEGKRYAVHRSLWILIFKEGRWGVQARSSYAP